MDVLGGAGSYAALGARLFSPAPHASKSVGWIVDQGSDFPPAMTDLINSWSTSCLFRHDDNRLTTRAWNGYVGGGGSSSKVDASGGGNDIVSTGEGSGGGGGGQSPVVGDPGLRAFRYTTPKKRLTPDDLPVPTPIPSPSNSVPSTPGHHLPHHPLSSLPHSRHAANPPPLLSAKSFHLICSPARCREVVTDLIAARRAAGISPSRPPVIVWEPVPDRCSPDELLACTNALPLVDVCSPNHAELAAFMGDEDGGVDPRTGEVRADAVERACEQLLASMPLQSYALVVRAAERGVFVTRNGGRKRKAAAESKKPTAAAATAKKKPKKEYARGGIRPDTDMFALLAGLVQDEDGAVAREEIEVDPGLERWFPAYHTAAPTAEAPAKEAKAADAETKPASAAAAAAVAEPKVVDPTGAGNAFLGALSIALARGRSIEESALWGSVAASFAVEQVGVPVLDVDAQGNETWNGARVEERLAQFVARVG